MCLFFLSSRKANEDEGNDSDDETKKSHMVSKISVLIDSFRFVGAIMICSCSWKHILCFLTIDKSLSIEFISSLRESMLKLYFSLITPLAKIKCLKKF